MPYALQLSLLVFAFTYNDITNILHPFALFSLLPAMKA